jgi:hypothetical protein
MATSSTTTEIGDVGLFVSLIGAIGYAVTIALPDDATGFWGVVCDVLTLWGWGLPISLGLVGVFAILALIAKLSARSTRAPRWLVAPLAVAATAAAAPVLVVVALLCLSLGAAASGPQEPW